MLDPFSRAFNLVIGHEGGYTTDPTDRGNWTGGERGRGQLKGTKYGISAAAAAAQVDRRRRQQGGPGRRGGRRRRARGDGQGQRRRRPGGAQGRPRRLRGVPEGDGRKAIALEQEETARLREREQSWREATKSEDAYVRRARPTIIYALVAIGVSGAATALVTAWREPAMLPDVISALQWIVYALASVGGLYVVKRSDDKAAAGGLAPPQGALRKVAGAVLGE